jgi:hypothetical protein
MQQGRLQALQLIARHADAVFSNSGMSLERPEIGAEKRDDPL